MKSVRIFVLVLLAAAAFGCGDAVAARATASVTAQTGLILRDAPAVTGAALATLPHAAQVAVLDADSGPAATIGGVSGRWTKVTYQGKTGWAFGGFLAITRKSTAPAATGANAVFSALAGIYVESAGAALHYEAAGSPGWEIKPGSIRHWDPYKMFSTMMTCGSIGFADNTGTRKLSIRFTGIVSITKYGERGPMDATTSTKNIAGVLTVVVGADGTLTITPDVDIHRLKAGESLTMHPVKRRP